MSDTLVYEQRFVEIGGLRMTVQAFVVLSLGCIAAATLLVAALMLRKPVLAVIALVVLAVFLYRTYVMNCLVVGNCVLLSWLLVGLMVLHAFFVGWWMVFVYAAARRAGSPARRSLSRKSRR